MIPITFKVSMLMNEGEDALPPRDKANLLVYLLDILAKADDTYLRQHPDTPRIYESGVVYQTEMDPENWMDIGAVLKQRWADCKNVAAWRAAELRSRGIEARAVVKWTERPQGTLFHIVVLRAPIARDLPPGLPNERFLRKHPASGKWIEDPSAVLGM